MEQLDIFTALGVMCAPTQRSIEFVLNSTINSDSMQHYAALIDSFKSDNSENEKQ